MKLSDYVVEFIARLGVKHVFMLPGGGAMHLNDSLGRNPAITYICNLHEQASAIAAEAYGQYSGLGVAMVTTGPGGTNALTGVAGAWLESTPLLVVSGQVKRADLAGNRGVRQMGFQEIDIVSIVKPVTKYAVTVLDPETIAQCLGRAVWEATHGRKGPVWVDIPLDVQAAEIDAGRLAAFEPPGPDTSMREKVEQAAQSTLELLSCSKRPVVLVGNGVRHANAVEKFVSWAEGVGIPILTTWKALDFVPEDHPQFVGRPGAVGQRAANFAQQTCDLFISIGARLDYGQTAYNHGNFAPRAQKVVIDIDPAEIAKLQMNLAVSLAADAGAFVDQLLRLGATRRMPRWDAWLERCLAWKRRYPVTLPEYEFVTTGVHNYIFVRTLGLALKEGDILVAGSSGACSEVTCQALPSAKGMRFVNTQGLGAMGFGVPAAIGACLAAGGVRTICVDGDGGFLMNAQELTLVSQLALPIKFFVLNNAGYGSIRTMQVNYFSSRFVACDGDSGLHLPDLSKIAACGGIEYRKIDAHLGLARSIAEVLRTPGPVICDVVMAPNQFTQPKVSSRQRPDGSMETMPMEDLWPFMDRADLEENMKA